MPESPFGWLLLAIAAFGIGITKSGFSGVSMVHVILFAHVFGARESTGIVLPMLIAGDIFAMTVYGKHANWKYVRRMFGPAMIGVVAGWLLMFRLDEKYYRPLIGTIILGLTVLQIIRIWKEEWLADVPHARWFAWSMGILVGLTTMLANAAGPVFGLYLLAIGLPKMEFVGTAAWFFLLLNISKIPFSWSLGLIRLDTLALNAALMPLIGLGLWIGTMVVRRIPQKLFDSLILIFTGVAALRMLFL
ncbi:MAG: sulfite exporter TauE/SafE family protein [Pirellula sp.]|nr:sulfite exporter TauE/SafE family protein [Pirellula sp.]